MAVPFKILAVNGDRAEVEAGGVRREAVVAFIDNPAPGDYVLLHAGLAVRKWTEKDFAEFQALTGNAAMCPAPRG